MPKMVHCSTKVTHQEIGEIILDKVSTKLSLGHGLSRNKAIAYSALPEVLEKGEIIYFSDNWKQRGYQTCAVAAPFNIGVDQYYMVAVVSNETKKDRYYTHDVVYTKIDDTLFKTGNKVENNSVNSGNVSSTYSLLYELVKVKQLQNDSIDQNTRKSQDRVDDFLTREQKEFFKDSKVRDEKGNLLKMYHGTPYGGFTVFKNDLNYFTSNKEYADR